MASKITTSNTVDTKLVQGANYTFNAEQRQYIDDQALGAQTHLVNELISGSHETFFPVTSAYADSAIGDVVVAGDSNTVIRAIPADMDDSATVMGVVTQPAPQGGRIRVVLNGMVPASVTGLSALAGFVRVSAAGRCEYVSAVNPGDYVLGSTNSAGNLTMARIAGAESAVVVDASAVAAETITGPHALRTTTSGHVVKGNSSLTSLPFIGINLASVTSGNAVSIQTSGIVPTSVINLGAGVACAVGVTSAGVPVRATDATCVSAPNWLGSCDAAGVITVNPIRQTTFNVLDFGLIPDGSTDNSVAMRNLLANAAKSTDVGTVFFPGGQYSFSQQVGPVPNGISIKGSGPSSIFGSNKGSKLIFTGPGSGIQINTDGTGGNASNGCTISDLEIAGGLATGHSAPLTNTSMSVASWAGRSPIPTVSGTPDAQYLWDILITTTGPRGTAQFRWSDDGSTTYQAPQATGASILMAHGVTIAFPAGTYTSGDHFTFQSIPNYNECGIEVIGDADVTIQKILSGGFKYQISLDGAEVAIVRDINFGAASAGYTDMGTDLGDDSAAAIRVGSFKFTVSDSANAIYVSECQLNNTRIGLLIKDGISQTYRNMNSEVTGEWALIQAGRSLVFDTWLGEGQNVAGFYFNGPAHASSFCIGVTVKNCFIGSKPLILLDDAFTINGLEFASNTVTGMSVRYPIEASHITGLNWAPSNFVDSTHRINNYSSPQQSSPNGQSIGHGKAAGAALDVKINSEVGVPFMVGRIDDTIIYTQLGGPSSLYGGTIESFDQLYSPSSGLVFGRATQTVSSVILSTSASATSLGSCTTVDHSGGVVVATVTAQAWDGSSYSNIAYWQLRQGVYNDSSAAYLLGGTALLEDNFNVSFTTVPSLVTSGKTVAVSISGHSVFPSTWTVKMGYLGAAR